jgi:FhuF 2Fe-2S C-terminal domain
MAGTPVEFRVAASIGHQGLVARLLCPAFGAALVGCRLDLRQAWWRPVLGGAMPLSVSADAIRPASGPIGLSWPVRDLVTLTAALSVSPRVLWGNVVSAINGAVTAISNSRPDLSDLAVELGAVLLADPHLVAAFVGPLGEHLRRRSCCLIYRIAPNDRGNYCGDCILR